MKRSICACLIFLYSLTAFSQDSLKKTNPIIFFENTFSLPLNQLGVQLNFDLNYQQKGSIYTLRFVGAAYFDIGATALSPINYFPTISDKGGLQEYGFLYGRRYIRGGQSFSFSAGLSLNDRTGYTAGADHQQRHYESHYMGIPFELTWLVFKSTRKRYHIYGMIPVGKPTAFGPSFGFKISGNVSQHGYGALGLLYGVGYHKQY